MKRGLFIVFSLILSVSAGLAAAVAAGAESGPAAVGPTTTHVTTTEPPPPTTPTTPATIPPGVRIGRTDVGSYEPAAAAELVRAAFEQPLQIVYARHRFMVKPATLGAVPSINRAVERALIAPPGSTVPLAVGVRLQRVRAYVAGLAGRFGRKPADARLLLRGLKPYVTKERRGRSVDRSKAERMIVSALVAHQRGPLTLPGRTLEPSVKRTDFGPVIVIRRNTHRLYLYRGMRYWKLFPVATGTNTYPTPLGRFRIVVKWRNPWWYPPDSDWAKDLEPVPPGPSNPLGTRWMGISSPGVGIHGTPEPGSIGYSVSHGCIRMRISDAEWMFEQVPIGTPVFIVAA